jgi:hypothetical protein
MAADFRPRGSSAVHNRAAQTEIASGEAAAACANARDEFDDFALMAGGLRADCDDVSGFDLRGIALFDRSWGIKGEHILVTWSWELHEAATRSEGHSIFLFPVYSL